MIFSESLFCDWRGKGNDNKKSVVNQMDFGSRHLRFRQIALPIILARQVHVCQAPGFGDSVGGVEFAGPGVGAEVVLLSGVGAAVPGVVTAVPG